jgi:hypothetical protein
MSADKMLRLATSVFADTPARLYGIPYHLTYRTSGSMPFTCYSLSLSRDLMGRWTHDKVSAAIIKDIIEGCKLDARTCTHAQLEETDPYVCCLTCLVEGKPSTMRWDQAVGFLSKYRCILPTINAHGSRCFNSLVLCSTSTGDPSIPTCMSREVLGVFSTPKRRRLPDLCGSLLTPGMISLDTSVPCAANPQRYCVAILCPNYKIISYSGECCH